MKSNDRAYNMIFIVTKYRVTNKLVLCIFVLQVLVKSGFCLGIYRPSCTDFNGKFVQSAYKYNARFTKGNKMPGFKH